MAANLLETNSVRLSGSGTVTVFSEAKGRDVICAETVCPAMIATMTMAVIAIAFENLDISLNLVRNLPLEVSNKYMSKLTKSVTKLMNAIIPMFLGTKKHLI
jgi:hypothetical protein